MAAYSNDMDRSEHKTKIPAGWIKALAESEAQLAAGQIVFGEEVMRELRESIDRLEVKRAAKSRNRAVRRG